MTGYVSSQSINMKEKISSVLFPYVVFYSSDGLFSSFFTSTQFFTWITGENKQTNKLKEGALKKMLCKYYRQYYSQSYLTCS